MQAEVANLQDKVLKVLDKDLNFTMRMNFVNSCKIVLANHPHTFTILFIYDDFILVILKFMTFS